MLPLRFTLYLICLFCACYPCKGIEGGLFSPLPENIQLTNKQLKRLDILAAQLAQKHGITFLLRGLGKIVDQKETAVGFSFTDEREMTIEQGRPLAVMMYTEFSNEFKKNPLFKNWMIWRESPRLDFSWAFGMKISFWDKNFDRPLAPKLSQIRVVEDKINYYYASSKDQSLELVHSESIKDAIELVSKPKNCEQDVSAVSSEQKQSAI